MAIERTYIDNTDIDTALAKLAEYLQKKAVPEYFSSVESNEGVISCYTENNFLIMTIEYPMNSKGVTIYTKNGTSVNINTTSSGQQRFGYAYKCDGGVLFNIRTTTGDTYPCAMAITKDDTGKTVIIAEYRLVPSASTTSNVPVYVVNPDSDSITPVRLARCATPDFSKTVLAPFVVLGTKGNYTPNVFIQLFEHNTEQGTLEIDGVKYFSNGLWCVKDE
ncbi:MAG: hypothetical protein K2J08_03725 [Ruminococcus sp.]|nr:hypothetical protein [Ruminococcus sp.]